MRSVHVLMVLALGAGVAVAAGCELIASIDRTAIPVATGAGGGGTGGSGGASSSSTGGGSGGTGGTMLADGTPCADAAQCNSGFCADGVCCGAACDADCESCTEALKEGGGADGECGPSATGAACGDTAGCTNATLTAADSCDANGTCNDGGSMMCPSGYQCDPAGMACLTTCAGDTDCIATHFCDVNTCVPDNGPGQPCQNNNQCGTGNCVDGVCCDTACNGTCEACDVAGNVGTCSPAPSGSTEPGCTGNSACNGMGACASANGQACTMAADCASAHCVDSFCCNTACTANCDACNNAGTEGTCGDVPLGTVDPGCGATNTTCNATGQCRLPGGAACGGDTECASGSCPSPPGLCTTP